MGIDWHYKSQSKRQAIYGNRHDIAAAAASFAYCFDEIKINKDK